MRKITCCYCVCMLLMSCIFGQIPDYASHKEKIYIHTSHVFFQPGDVVFFKLYLVNAGDQRPATLSKTAFVEILNPAGSIIRKLHYKITDGYTEGSFDFDQQAAGGIYKIRAYTSWMRNESDSTFFTKEITLQKVIAPRVLMKLDFPRKGYGPGDEVTADYAIRNLAGKPIANYKIDYKVSIAGKAVQTAGMLTDGEGKARLRFRLPADLNSSDGLLNVAVQYNSYTEAISRSIPIVLHKIDLQLMPEGGTLVAGLMSNIAFRAVNENGQPADIKGEVLDDSGARVAAFESYYAGMGQFSFTPQAGKKYTVKITSPLHIAQQYPFPAFTAAGVVLNFIKEDKKLLLRLTASGPQKVILTGRTKNVACYTKSLSLEKGAQTVEIDPALFPAGIAQFTLSDGNGLPLAERLVFLNGNNILHVKITTDKAKYLPREKVVMKVTTTDDKGLPLPSNLSLSVMDDKLWSFADDKQDHILSWLLISSELKGRIEDPSFYFKQEEPKSRPALDLVMLTHGYRYFDYIPAVRKEGRLKYLPDNGYLLSGTIVNEKQEPVKAEVFLINLADKGKAIQMTTDADGEFFFSGLDGKASYSLVAKSTKSKERVSIRMAQNDVDLNDIRGRKIMPQRAGKPMLPQQPEDANAVMNVVEFHEKGLPERAGQEDRQLNDVVVVGFGAQKKKNVTGAIVRIRRDELPDGHALAALEGRMAGVNVLPQANPGADMEIRIRGSHSLTGNNQPLYVIDGVPVSGLDAGLNPNDIASLQVLTGEAATAVYGSRGANGVIIITTKSWMQEKVRFDLRKQHYYTTLFFPAADNYSVARRFYAPHYASTETKERNDFRETIYWNPVVQTGKTGQATLEFYNSDASTTFRAVAEGIAWNGKPGRAEATWSAQSALQIDAKIPPYLLTGDIARVPLVLKNTGPSAQELAISLTLPAHITAGQYENKIMLPAGSSRQVLIPLEATAPADGVIRFTVNDETLSLPVTATERGFPVINTFSGDKQAQHRFTINQPVDGSIKTSLRVFDTPEGQLLDGIESMLREPHGCFEQTSSSTYPNIFILKYLRESGKTNPEVTARAMKYIESGYKRLISYETAQHGFEWFGHTPPHEALTAYGLLEFTDMQAFIDVDKDMLARTKAFLLSRRDGKGSFKLATRGLDQFAAVPDAIANIYIVYALTQAGIGQEIAPEYKTALKKALESGDAYQMAMMALAADNMKNGADYQQLMQLLEQNYREKHLSAVTTVVNSRDVSLRVETLSLYIMALGRAKTPDTGKMAFLISKIMSEKTYYGYGSTQATVLALNAIGDYLRIKGSSPHNGVIRFAVNDRETAPGKDIRAALKNGGNTFAIHYSDEKNALPYSLEVSYYTLTPPHSPEAELKLTTLLSDTVTRMGETVRMKIEVKNVKPSLQPMSIAKIGIPAGLSLQPWQLKELTEKNGAAYYEIFDNYLVLYWMGFRPGETKTVNLDLKADIPGAYRAKASNCYLYYTPEHKDWQEGTAIKILP